MSKSIKLFRNNEERDWQDEEWIDEFLEFLQGNPPDSIHLVRGHAPKLSKKKAWSIVWYLQEHFPILPDSIEMCYNCGSIFDSDEEGVYWESKHRHYCDGCLRFVPENHDRGKR